MPVSDFLVLVFSYSDAFAHLSSYKDSDLQDHGTGLEPWSGGPRLQSEGRGAEQGREHREEGGQAGKAGIWRLGGQATQGHPASWLLPFAKLPRRSLGPRLEGGEK